MNSSQLKQQVKKFNDGITDVPYERPIVDAVDKLLEMAKTAGYPTHLTSEQHWLILEKICDMWATCYPEQYEEFKKVQTWNKTNQKTEYASGRESGGAEIRHMLEMPMKLYQMIHAVFPLQKIDKEFALKMGRRLELFRWSAKQ